MGLPKKAAARRNLVRRALHRTRSTCYSLKNTEYQQPSSYERTLRGGGEGKRFAASVGWLARKLARWRTHPSEPRVGRVQADARLETGSAGAREGRPRGGSRPVF